MFGRSGEPAVVPASQEKQDKPTWRTAHREDSHCRPFRSSLFLLLLPAALHAQLALFSFDGSTDTPVGQTYNFGNVAAGDVKDVRFHLKNIGTTAVTNAVIGTPQGTGFSLFAVNGSRGQNTIAPGAELEFTIRFTTSLATLGTYSASLQLTSSAPTITVILLASVTGAPVITVFPACTAGSNGGVVFPSVAIGSVGLCNFSVQNQTSQPMTVTISVAGDPAFQAPPSISAPITLRPNDAFTFAIQFTPVCGTLNYGATLTVSGRSFPLAATGLTPPLPKPSLVFDSTKISSGEQHTITMSLPTPAVCGANGNLNLAFAGAADDRSIFFLAGSTRTLPFAVKAGDTQISINGASSATFQTGTTAGTITFSLSGTQINGDATTTLTVVPAPIAIETAAASNQRLGELDVQIVGFDNTYSAGAMSFTFFDTSGKAIGQPIAADFTSDFKTFYSGVTTGSTFLMRVSFPVQGDPTQVAKVQITLTNSAGQAQTGSLTFQ